METVIPKLLFKKMPTIIAEKGMTPAIERSIPAEIIIRVIPRAIIASCTKPIPSISIFIGDKNRGKNIAIPIIIKTIVVNKPRLFTFVIVRNFSLRLTNQPPLFYKVAYFIISSCVASFSRIPVIFPSLNTAILSQRPIISGNSDEIIITPTPLSTNFLKCL